MRPRRRCWSALAAWLVGIGVVIGVVIGGTLSPLAGAEPDATPTGPDSQGLVEFVAPTSDAVDPASALACAQFAAVLDGTAVYYGDFAEALEAYDQVDYSDPAVSSSNVVGRTALRQGAAAARAAAGTPGLDPAIANPLRSWAFDATKLLLKMGLRADRQSLNETASELNGDALTAQEACAAAGTHA